MQCARGISGITLNRYDQYRYIGKSNNLKVIVSNTIRQNSPDVVNIDREVSITVLADFTTMVFNVNNIQNCIFQLSGTVVQLVMSSLFIITLLLRLQYQTQSLLPQSEICDLVRMLQMARYLILVFQVIRYYSDTKLHDLIERSVLISNNNTMGLHSI